MSQEIENISDQINSVVNNLANKLEAPTEAITKIANYGFEKYTKFIRDQAITIIILEFILFCCSIVFGLIAYKFYLQIKENGRNDGKEIGMVIFGLCSFGLFMFCLITFGKQIPIFLNPEAVVIKEIINSINQ